MAAPRQLQGWLTPIERIGDALSVRSPVGTGHVGADKQWVDISVRILEADRELDPGSLWDVPRPKIDGVDRYERTAVTFSVGQDLCISKGRP